VSAHDPATPERSDFIREIVSADVREGRVSEVVTRFPPEPNGYLHIGHPKSIALNFGIAREFGGRCHLRFDDTNPIKEEQEYIDSIQQDIRWLGFDWGEHLYYASDYFHQLYDWAVSLIKAGKAYVDDLAADEIREHRGTLTEPGKNSPWRVMIGRRARGSGVRRRWGQAPLRERRWPRPLGCGRAAGGDRLAWRGMGGSRRGRVRRRERVSRRGRVPRRSRLRG